MQTISAWCTVLSSCSMTYICISFSFDFSRPLQLSSGFGRALSGFNLISAEQVGHVADRGGLLDSARNGRAELSVVVQPAFTTAQSAFSPLSRQQGEELTFIVVQREAQPRKGRCEIDRPSEVVGCTANGSDGVTEIG